MRDFDWSHRRSDWENPNQTVADNTNSGPFPWGTADKIVIHYTGAVDVPDGDPDELPWEEHVEAYLRAIQNDYVTNRGYSIGYNCLVTQDGDDWELRGTTFQAAANKGRNSETFTILVFVDGVDRCSDAAVIKIRQIVEWFRSQSPFGLNVQIKGHRDIGATACPGAGVYNQIIAGVFEPRKETVTVSTLTFRQERLLDTRDLGKPTAAGGQVITLNAPAGALAVKVNLRAVHALANGYMTAYAAGGPRPDTADLTYWPAATISGEIDVPVRNGKFSVYVHTPTHVIVDLKGYWT